MFLLSPSVSILSKMSLTCFSKNSLGAIGDSVLEGVTLEIEDRQLGDLNPVFCHGSFIFTFGEKLSNIGAACETYNDIKESGPGF